MKKKIVIPLALLLLIAVAVFFILHNNKSPIQAQTAVKPVPADSVNALWYKAGVIYNVDVEKFKDSNGDGIGDFNGLTQKLGYIDSLGFTVIWLAPFQPTPNLDDGYDVSDFYGIDKRLGTPADFAAFMQAANARHLRVIMDLVVNHTSDQCSWFQEARQSKASPYHNWYVWSNKRPGNYNVGMVFPGVQNEIWSYDTMAKQYYYHRFYNFQPDLNMQNKAVQQEVLYKVVKYWMDKGMAGFRMDAVPFVIEVPQTKGDNFPLQFQLLDNLRTYIQSLRKDAIILGEANVDPKQNKDYFGAQGDRITMMFNFFVNQHLFYALATGDVKPLESALQRTQDIPAAAQWGQFLRNHDEIDLGRLSKKDRQRVFDKMGPDKGMQLYNRGIRRRLAPMLNNEQEIKMAYSLLFSLPNTPVVRYGEEIGMGDNLSLSERNSIRTPMQWDSTKDAGFSTAALTVTPLVDTGNYNYKKVNVTSEQRDSASLLSFIQRIIALHKSRPEISYGSWRLLEVNNAHVLAIQYNWQGRMLLVLHNFSAAPESITLLQKNSLQDLLTQTAYTPANGKTAIFLAGYGFVWLQ